MAVTGTRYTVDSTTPLAIPVADNDNRRGMVLIIQNPHSENRHLLLGGPDLNATTNRGHELTGGESLQITFPLQYDDVIYALAESGTGLNFTALAIGV